MSRYVIKTMYRKAKTSYNLEYRWSNSYGLMTAGTNAGKNLSSSPKNVRYQYNQVKIRIQAEVGVKRFS